MPFEIVPADTKIDFIGKRRIAAILSVLVLLAGVAAIPLQGIRLGVDFAGGMEILVRFEPGVAADEGAIRSIVSQAGVDDPSVVRYDQPETNQFLIRFRTETAGERGELVGQITRAVSEEIGPLVPGSQRVEFVGPRVGAELRRDGLASLAIACALILVYIAFRFSPRFGPGAIVALVHDVSITAGIFVILGLEFDLRVLAALLAILGYSLNDTIIIYDRIRENMKLHTKQNLIEVLNRSVNQTLSRTILTSGTTLAVVLSLLFLGGEVIRPFAIAMVIGIVVGTYSSVFIAAPMLLFLETHFGGEAAAPVGRPSKSRKAAKAVG